MVTILQSTDLEDFSTAKMSYSDRGVIEDKFRSQTELPSHSEAVMKNQLNTNLCLSYKIHSDFVIDGEYSFTIHLYLWYNLCGDDNKEK